MKIVKNRFIPLPGFKYINLFGVLFTREDTEITIYEMNHESIHTAQMREMLYIPFYLWYLIEWCVRLVQYRDKNKAYRYISFEREAYCYQRIYDYLTVRKPFEWLKWLRSNK